MFKVEAFDTSGEPIIIIGLTPEDVSDLLKTQGVYFWDFKDLQYQPKRLLIFAEETEEKILERIHKYDPKGHAH